MIVNEARVLLELLDVTYPEEQAYVVWVVNDLGDDEIVERLKELRNRGAGAFMRTTALGKEIVITDFEPSDGDAGFA